MENTYITQNTEYNFKYTRVFKSLLENAAELGISIDMPCTFIL